MKLIRGSVSEAICYAKDIPIEVENDLIEICSYEFSKNHRIRVMPDASANFGGQITGFTMDYTDYLVMGLEYGAGCGICLLDVGKGKLDLQKLDEICHEIPTQSGEYWFPPPFEFDISGFRFEGAKKAFAFLPFSLGNLGDGNHFIEIDRDEEGNNYIVVHNGIEGVASHILSYYRKLAVEKNGKSGSTDLGLEDTILSGKDMEDYLHDSDLSVRLSKQNRKFLAEYIAGQMHLDIRDELDICHHYVDTSDHIVRHGAISAHKGERVLIPINSRDGTILGVGKGNPEWNYSAPHGAGRLMTRKKAKEIITLDQYQKSVENVFSTCVCMATLDEAPDAYRGIDDIAGEIRDTVEIEKILKPVYNFKGIGN